MLGYVVLKCCDRLAWGLKDLLKLRPKGRNISTQHITTLLGATCCASMFASLLRRELRHVGCSVVGSNLTILKLEPTVPNMLQQSDQTPVTCCAQRYVEMLQSFGRGFKGFVLTSKWLQPLNPCDFSYARFPIN